MTRSVLVVDDHPSPATSAAHALEAAGYIARVATSVDAALVELADVRIYDATQSASWVARVYKRGRRSYKP